MMIVQINEAEKENENSLKLTTNEETDLANINMSGRDKGKKHEIDKIDVL